MKELAFDRSVRSYDQDGRLRVATSPITKATVNPYRGREIPDNQALGLDPEKVYYLLRDPAELQKAVSTFNNLPLLIKHQPIDVDNHPKELVIGTTGSNAEWCDPYIQIDLTFWDAAAIAGIETKEQTELSSAYYYDADMTPGVFQGMRYDGVMRNIQGNHVALVNVGRAGRDVVVQDNDPFIKGKPMSKEQKLAAAKAKAKQALLAADAKPEDMDRILSQLAQDAEEAAKSEEDKKAEDEDDEDKDKEAEDEGEEDNEKSKKAEDDDDEKDDKKSESKAAMDAATVGRLVASAKKEATQEAVKHMQDLYAARDAVKPLVGECALDSAEDVYRFALNQSGVDTKGVHPSAFPAMVKQQLKLTSQAATPKMGMDAAVVESTTKAIPNLQRFL